MSVKSIFPAICISGIWLMAYAPAQACSFRAGPLSVAPLSYDPFAFKPVSARAEMILHLEEGTDCPVSVRLLDDSQAPLNRIEIGSTDKAIFDIRPIEQGTAHLDPGTKGFEAVLNRDTPELTLRWDFVLTQDAVLPPGDYTQVLIVAVNSGPISPALQTRGAFLVRALSRAQVNIAGASGTFGSSALDVIDFGTLITGKQRRAFVQIRANSAVNITISSKNRGVMRNESFSDAAPIPYSMVLDERPVSLDSVTQIPFSPPSTVDGISLPMDLTVDDADNKMAGRYSDIITIDVSR